MPILTDEQTEDIREKLEELKYDVMEDLDNNKGQSIYSGMRYEDGIIAAIEYILNDREEHPTRE